MDEKQQDAAPAKKKRRHILGRKSILDFNQENDIKFRGPLSYRHLRIAAWASLVISQIGVMLTFSCLMNGDPNTYGAWPNILSFFSTFMAPLFLIAAFSVVLNAKDGYRRLIILYTGLTVLVYVAFVIVYRYYAVGLADAIAPGKGGDLVDGLLHLIGTQGFFTFNIFLDLLLCTLVTFFLNYTPTHHFQGKKLILFRLFALLPILYELASITLKVLCSGGFLVLSPFIYPLLTTKAPMAFLIFVSMAFFIKNREKHFLKHGKTHEDYVAFSKTNVYSFQFSARLGFIIFIVSILDVILMVALSVVLFLQVPVSEEVAGDIHLLNQFEKVLSWGFGQTTPLLFIIPLVLLFDYKKTYDDSMIDVIIPLGGIALLAFVYFEGGFEVLKWFLADKLKEATNEDVASSIAGIFHGIIMQ